MLNKPISDINDNNTVPTLHSVRRVYHEAEK